MKKVLRILSVAIVSVFMFTALFGCGTKAGSGGNSTAQVTTEVKEKVLTTNVSPDPDTLCMLFSTRSITGDIARYLNAALLQYDNDGSLIPYIAESMPTVSDDKKTITFKVRKDVKWHDSVALTAADIKYTFDLILDPKVPTTVGKSEFSCVEKVETPDDYTVIFTLKYPDSTVMQYFAVPVLVPKHIWEKEDRSNLKNSKAATDVIGCGPFKFKEWKKGERIVFEKNPDFFYSKVKLDKIVYEVITSDSTAMAKLDRGEINVFNGMSPEYVEKYKTSISGMKVVPVKQTIFNFVMYNLKTEFFSDKKVRQAIAYAVNKEAYVQGIYKGQAYVIDTDYPPGHPVNNPNVKKYSYNIETAKKMLDEAGWKVGKDGIREKNGKAFKFKLSIRTGSLQEQSISVLLKSQLKPIGIDVEIQSMDENTLMESYVYSGKFDALLYAFRLDGNDHSLVWHSDPVIGIGNWGKYVNTDMDKLWDKAKTEFNVEEQKKIYGQVQEMLAEDQPFLFLLSRPSFSVMKDNVQPQMLDYIGDIKPYDVDIK